MINTGEKTLGKENSEREKERKFVPTGTAFPLLGEKQKEPDSYSSATGWEDKIYVAT